MNFEKYSKRIENNLNYYPPPNYYNITNVNHKYSDIYKISFPILDNMDSNNNNLKGYTFKKIENKKKKIIPLDPYNYKNYNISTKKGFAFGAKNDKENNEINMVVNDDNNIDLFISKENLLRNKKLYNLFRELKKDYSYILGPGSYNIPNTNKIKGGLILKEKQNHSITKNKDTENNNEIITNIINQNINYNINRSNYHKSILKKVKSDKDYITKELVKIKNKKLKEVETNEILSKINKIHSKNKIYDNFKNEKITRKALINKKIKENLKPNEKYDNNNIPICYDNDYNSINYNAKKFKNKNNIKYSLSNPKIISNKISLPGPGYYDIDSEFEVNYNKNTDLSTRISNSKYSNAFGSSAKRFSIISN